MPRRFTVDTLEFLEDSGCLSYRPSKAKRAGHATVGLLVGAVATAVGFWLVLGHPLSRLTGMALDIPFGVYSLITGAALFTAVPIYLYDARRGVQIDSSGEVVRGKRVMRVSSVDALETVFHPNPMGRGHNSWSVSLKEGGKLIQLPWLRFFHEFEAERVRTEIAQFLS